MDVKVGISAKLLETDVSLRLLMELKAGDIIPVEMPESLLISVEDLPTFRTSWAERRKVQHSRLQRRSDGPSQSRIK